MRNLMKYEFRKSWKMKVFILCITAFFEAFYLIGLTGMNDKILGLSIMGLTFTAVCGVFIIGIYGIHVLSKDINTKQSYMLFMTPNSSYKILGSKMLENGGSIFISGIFFSVLAVLDVIALTARYHDIKGLLDMLNLIVSYRGYELNYKVFVLSIISLVTFWIFVTALGYLAVVLCATVLKGNRYNGVLSFILFVIIAIFVDYIWDFMVGFIPRITWTQIVFTIFFYLLFTAIMYVITAWFRDNKLSV